MAFPQSQKPLLRPVGFLLDDKTADSAVPPFLFAPLVIRPEHLTRPEQSRSNVAQTLGGAWVDNFGPGLATIQISGTTGWRGGWIRDGMQEFLYLHDIVYKQWHSRRDTAIKNGVDPNDVRLIFIDGLDSQVAVVEPKAFRLDRDKQRPLLVQYNIIMTVISDGVPGDGFPMFKTGLAFLDDALSAIGDALSTIQDGINTVKGWIDTFILAPVSAFMGMTQMIFGQVQQIIGTVQQVTGSIVGAALGIAQGGMNLFRSLTSLVELPLNVAGQIMGIAGAYSTLFCTLTRTLQNVSLLPNFSDVYGASGCSSTGGGRPISPLRNTNPFDGSLPNTLGSESLFVPAAQSAITSLARLDPSNGATATKAVLASHVLAITQSPLRT